MKRKEWRDMKKIFTFTFRSQMRSKKYRTALILVCILLFAVPLLVMAAAGRTGDSPDPAAQPEAVNPVAQVYVVDETGLGIRGFDAIHWEEEWKLFPGCRRRICRRRRQRRRIPMTA